MYAEHKAATLAHCLRIAAVDPEYAIWAAGWYETNAPWLLTNLQAKVQQEVARARQSSFACAPAPARTTASTGRPGRAA